MKSNTAQELDDDRVADETQIQMQVRDMVRDMVLEKPSRRESPSTCT